MLRDAANFDLRMLACCKLCGESLLYIYDQALRDYCYECLIDMSLENARRIINPSGKKK